MGTKVPHTKGVGDDLALPKGHDLVLDAVDELPPWFIKFVQKISTFFKTSCKRYTEFKELIKKAFEDFLVDNPHPEKDEKLRYKMYYFTSRAAPHPPGCVPVPPVLQVLSVWLALLLLTRVRLRAWLPAPLNPLDLIHIALLSN